MGPKDKCKSKNIYIYIYSKTYLNLYSTEMGLNAVFFFLISSVMAAAANVLTDQRALLVLKDHITHDPTNLLSENWTSNTSVCNWIGVTCDIHWHRVTALNISYFDLTGAIPSQLGNLSSLQTLDLSNNQLSGPIPSSIFSISTLKLLDLSFNQLSGSFPSLISNRSSLQVLDLNFNGLSDEFPPNLCNNLPFLEHFFFTGNMFHGEIPSNLSNCKQLQLLSLSFNEFSGSIPYSFSNLTKLQGLYLGYNKLKGMHDMIIEFKKMHVYIRLHIFALQEKFRKSWEIL